MNDIKKYVRTNKAVLTIFLVFTIVFYLLNLFVFSKDVDGLMVIVLTAIYMMFIPGVVTFITLITGDYNKKLKNVYEHKTAAIYFLAPFMLSLIISMCYRLISGDQITTYFEHLSINVLSFPVMVYGSMLYLHQRVLKLSVIKNGIIIIVVGLVSGSIFLITNQVYRNVRRFYWDDFSNVVMFFLIPTLYLIYLYVRDSNELKNVDASKEIG